MAGRLAAAEFEIAGPRGAAAGTRRVAGKMLLRPQPNRASRALLGLRFLVVAVGLLKLQQLTRQNAAQGRTVACLRAQLADSAKLGAARDVNACGVPDDATVAPSKEACAGTDDAATATEDTDEAFTAPRLATLAATLASASPPPRSR